MTGRLLHPGWLVLGLSVCLPASAADPAGVEFFESRIRPVLVQHCYSCHSAEARASKKLRGGLLLDTKEGVLKGGDSGPAIVPGKAKDSLLLAVLRHTGDVKMPPKGKLPENVIADFETWINRGAPDPRSGTAARSRGMTVEEGRKFWAYQPPRRHSVPEIRNPKSEIRNPVDAFIAARLSEKGVTPAPEADRERLLRRVYYDLTGLPPTPEEVEEARKAKQEDWYERVVERLLSSPAFGERWGRHWLDVARYAESVTLRGSVFKEAWRYRDHVIDSFNEDVPFDQFVREQVAGDLLPASSIEQRRRQLIATTFLTLGNTVLEEQDKKQLVMDVVDEQLDTIGRAFLAQTIGCARCHDHKFDPIPTRDYYALAGILRNTKTLEHANVSAWLEKPLPEPPEREKVLVEHEAKVAALQKQVQERKAMLAKTAKPEKPSEELRQLEQRLRGLIETGPRRQMVMTVQEEKVISDARVHIRGSVHTLGEPAPRGLLQVASSGPVPRMPADESGRRQLAEWLASRDNPLTARVFVNRAWHWLMGAGLVRTTDNFGTTGETPSHPDLLDWLATRFVEDGWSVKRLVRLIVLSHTYRQAHVPDAQVDPENRLFGRANRRRLDAECIRDTMLFVAGRLTIDRGGPTFKAGLASDYGYRHADTRRSVYAPVFRNALPELFEVFDFADPSVSTGRRNVSTVAPQALYLMNHPFVLEQSRHAARRLLAEPTPEAERINRAYRLALGRVPSAAEHRLAERFLMEGGQREETWAQLFQVLFASVDFRYVD